jgi:hypothetical protein
MSRDIRRALMIARSHYADGGETDPMLDQDQGMSIPEKPAYVMTPQPTGGVLTPSTFMGRLNSELKQRASDFGQGLASFPQTAYSAMQYPMQALRGETNRAVDPNTGNVVDVSPSGMTGDEAAMVGSGLVSVGTLPDIMAGKITPNMLRAGSAADRAVELAKAPRTDLGFYSHGAETAANLPQAKGTPQQFKSMLEKNGVKPAEMEGFDEAFAGRPSVTREEIAQHFNNNMPQVEERVLRGPYKGNVDELQAARDAAAARGDTAEADRIQAAFERQLVGDAKFQKHTLPGGENYREVLLKTPSEEYAKRQAMVAARAEKDKLVDQYGAMTDRDQARKFYPQVQEAIKKYNDSITAFQNSPKSFTGSHWDDPNVLAHIRMSDRVGPNGEKLLHVEELQSDWGQKGRKEGFSNPESIASTKEKIDQFSTQYDQLGRERRLAEQEMSDLPDYNERFNELQNRVSEIGRQRDLLSDQMASLRSTIKGNAVPTAPYVTSTQGWTDLALKRVMKEAAEGGYDGVVFTPGAEQAKRYDLSKQISHVQYDPNSKNLQAIDHNKNVVLDQRNVEPHQLPDFLGKEISEKLMDKKNIVPYSDGGILAHELSGQDLSIGGEGMNGYYNKIVPTQLQKLVKPLDKDVKLGTIKTNSLPEMLHLPITDKMREAILSGQKAFKRGGKVTPYNANDALKISSRFGPVAAQDAVNVAKQLARGRP